MITNDTWKEEAPWHWHYHHNGFDFHITYDERVKAYIIYVWHDYFITMDCRLDYNHDNEYWYDSLGSAKQAVNNFIILEL